jgi:hypothetical protein
MSASSIPQEATEEAFLMDHPLEASERSRWNSEATQHYEAFLQQLSVKGRATMDKHDERCEEDALQGYGRLWKRLAGGLGKLAGHATEVSGQQTVKFHIADGKYKLQVFALEDTRQGTIVIYLPDVLKLAMKRKILATSATSHHYRVQGCEAQLQLEPINAETKDLTACKAMVGWGRQALRADLSVNADEKQVRTVEMLCGIAAEKWTESPA